MKVEADLVVFNGNIITMDPQKPTATALAVKSYKVLAVGEEDEVLELVPNAKRVIDLGGKTVIPGFIDAHTHLTSAGVKAAHVQLGKVESVEEAVQFLRVAASKYPKGEWILGYDWDESEWTKKRFIQSKDLDPISKDHPIMATRICGHLASVNSLGLKKLGISLDQEGVQKDKLGRPTGVLKDIEEVWQKVRPTAEQIVEGVKVGNKIANEKGITTVVDNASSGTLGHIREIETRHEQTTRMIVNIPVEQMDHMISLGLTSGMGSPLVRIGGVKIFTDGSIGAKTAYVANGYRDDPKNKGMLLFPQKEYEAVLKKAVEHNIQTVTHAIGDEAIEMVISTFENLPDKSILREQRHRIEHAEMINEYQIRRAVSLGLILSMQPNFVGRWQQPGGLYDDRFEEERVRGMNMFRVALDNGARLCFGSDGMPYSPLYGIWSATTHYNDRVRLTVEEALRCYTMESAYSVFQENTLGSITVGKRADFVVLSDNILEVPADKIIEIDVEMTIVGGIVEYSASRL
ncbi:MAG: amidohydrolase [Candidatus Thorarchaeota archaeon]|nr:amidohydrolase [Candidatus Thorarchaeota archaeon]